MKHLKRYILSTHLLNVLPSWITELPTLMATKHMSTIYSNTLYSVWRQIIPAAVPGALRVQVLRRPRARRQTRPLCQPERGRARRRPGRQQAGEAEAAWQGRRLAGSAWKYQLPSAGPLAGLGSEPGNEGRVHSKWWATMLVAEKLLLNVYHMSGAKLAGLGKILLKCI